MIDDKLVALAFSLFERGVVALEKIATTQERIAVCAEAVNARRSAPGSTGGPGVASDRDLDSQYGDPQVKKQPRGWNGPNQVGKRYSQTSPEFLDMMADFLDWKAGKNDEDAADETAEAEDRSSAKKFAKYARADAARARGWAARLRAGWKPKANTNGASGSAGGAIDDWD